MGIVLKEEHMLADVSSMMSSELRRHCTPISFLTVFATCSHSFLYSLVLNLRALTPLILALSFFNGTCYNTQSQTNRHPSIERHIRRVQPLPSSILLPITCALTLSLNSLSAIYWWRDKEVPCPYP